MNTEQCAAALLMIGFKKHGHFVYTYKTLRVLIYENNITYKNQSN